MVRSDAVVVLASVLAGRDVMLLLLLLLLPTTLLMGRD